MGRLLHVLPPSLDPSYLVRIARSRRVLIACSGLVQTSGWWLLLMVCSEEAEVEEGRNAELVTTLPSLVIKERTKA
jgi:hypothetical protein